MIYCCSLSGEEKKHVKKEETCELNPCLLVCSHLAFSSLRQFRILFLGNGATNNGTALAVSINIKTIPMGQSHLDKSSLGSSSRTSGL